MALEQLRLPWLADWIPALMPDHAGGSIVALGIMPVLSAFYVIEVVALLVPGWRGRRRGTPVDRAPIDRAVIWLALGLAVLQAWFVVLSVQALAANPSGIDDRLWVHLAMTATLVGGVMLLAVIAGAISRAGLINGWLALLALGSARALFDLVTATSIAPTRSATPWTPPGSRRPRAVCWPARCSAASGRSCRWSSTSRRADSTRRPG